MFKNPNTPLKGRDRLTADNWKLKGTVLCPVHLSKENKYLINCFKGAQNLKKRVLKGTVASQRFFTIAFNAGFQQKILISFERNDDLFFHSVSTVYGKYAESTVYERKKNKLYCSSKSEVQ
jgi:hypothetical protein